MFVDTHCHLDFSQFDKDRSQVIEKAIDERVLFIVNPSIDLESSRKAIEISNEFDIVYACCGIHPHNASDTDDMQFNMCMKLTDNKKVVGIGETGLDFYYQHSDYASQINLFKKHIEFAKKLELPLIVHQRNAEKQMYEVFEDIKPPSKVVFHCFSGDEKMLEWAMEKGFYVSFTGILTFPDAVILRKIGEKVKIDRVFFETDAPYLTPCPYRGKRNEPRFVRFIVEEFSRIRKIKIEELAKITTENAMRFFNIQ